MASSLSSWALPQLSRLLPLDDDSLQQIISYTATLSKGAASEHLKNLLGDSAQAFEFISSFNQRRSAPADAASSTSGQQASTSSAGHDGVPKAAPRGGRGRGKKQPMQRQLPARRIADEGETAGGYQKSTMEDDYVAGRSMQQSVPKGSKDPVLAETLALDSQPLSSAFLDSTSKAASTASTPERSNTPATIAPTISREPPATKQPKLPPSAAGNLISDTPGSSRNASPARRSGTSTTNTQNKAKVNVTGGTAMRGTSKTLSDLDSAIRQLELQTNPTYTSSTDNPASDPKARHCPCQAQRHPLLAAAPNCLSCGKIICAKEGIGPCTFCAAPLLTRDQLHAMLRALKDERGRERQAAHNSAHKRAEVASNPRAFAMPAATDSAPGSDSETNADAESASLAAARTHRDRLLNFQAHNARRTAIHDEAADMDVPADGLSPWATPVERALQLKKQQAVLREQSWAARPEWEKRRVVVSLEVGKDGRARATRKMEAMGPEAAGDAVADARAELEDDTSAIPQAASTESGRFARNPLLGSLVRPLYTTEKGIQSGDGDGHGDGNGRPQRKHNTWRRVQDDDDGDNEAVILDGGAYGGQHDAQDSEIAAQRGARRSIGVAG